MSKVITVENLKTIDLIKELFSKEITTNDLLSLILEGENNYPILIRKLLEKGEPFCFENEGELPYLESSYNWELRIPNRKIEYSFDKFDLPVSFKSCLNYMDEYTQTGFDFFIRYDSNENLTLLVDDLKFDKHSDYKTILTAYYENKEKNLNYRLDVVLNDAKINYVLEGNKNQLYESYFAKSIKLTEEIKTRYGIEVPKLPLPF